MARVFEGNPQAKPSCAQSERPGRDWTYRGYDISDLATATTFEEVAYLILYGELPNATELAQYRTKLKSLRGLPDELVTTLEHIPSTAHPMDVMRTGCSLLGNLEPEGDFDNQQEVADRLLAVFPSTSITGTGIRTTAFGLM